MRRLIVLLTVMVLAGALPMPVTAQVAAKFDTARMQRDLDIMNAILDRLVFNAPGHLIRIGGDATKGIYLPNYGVIFFMPRRAGAFSVFQLDLERGRRNLEAYQKIDAYKKAAQQAKAGGRVETHDYVEGLQKIKAPLLEFFAKYADAIGQLEDSERIAVYVTSGDNLFFSFGPGWAFSSSGGEEAGSKNMLAVVRKSDIVALRTGQLKAEDFNNRVAFRDIDPETTSSEIDIMARIIDTALQGRSREPRFRSSNSRGIYLDDFGMIFFTNATFGQDLAVRIIEDLSKTAAEENLQHRILELQTASDQRRENWTAEYKKFKLRLGEVIADYGHTLRQLRPQENIVISADLENAPDDSPRYLVCSVKKQHVDAFNARRISREQLLKLISYWEY
ncbi:MAG: hypothetical protein ONB44_23950 [candidate division KSB1 bacterium]|nr:hypothetical protein [candidate division KSB1 bacterium]MDZ7305195.1 hypothetical protein [candidate division KSB1 bacterium]MDZ7314290.1 hypothetical protein [candidate division KSB1 bacterium]